MCIILWNEGNRDFFMILKMFYQINIYFCIERILFMRVNGSAV